MFGLIPKTKIWTRGGILAVFDSTDLDGHGRLGISTNDSGYILTLKNANVLYPDGYLKKFLNCTRAAVKSSVVKENSPGSMLKYWLGLNFDDKKSGETVRRILDDPDLSKNVKFAAIVSILTIQPEIPDDRLMGIIKNQTPPESITNMPFWRNLLFILPDFETADLENNHISQAKQWSEFGFFDVLLNRISFLSHAVEAETTSEYFARTGPNYFKPSTADDTEVIDDLYKTQPEKSLEREAMIDEAVKDMTAKNASRFYRYFTKTAPEFWPLLAQQLKSDEMDVERRFSKVPQTFSVKNISYYLSMADIWDIEQELKTNKNVQIWRRINKLGTYGAPIAAQFYRKAGLQAVIELISYCEKDPYTNLFLFSNQRFENVTKTITNRELIDAFLRVIDDEYKDMPIEWALQMNVPILKDSVGDDIYDDLESVIF